MKQTQSISTFSIPMVTVGSFLGGPLAAGYLIAQNFKAVGNKVAALKALRYGVIGLVAIGILSVIVPAEIIERVPSSFFGAAYAMIGYFAADKAEKVITASALAKTQKASWLKPIGVGVIAFFLMVITIVVFNSVAVQFFPQLY